MAILSMMDIDKVKPYINEESEIIGQKIFINKKCNIFYFKVRLLFSNKETEDITGIINEVNPTGHDSERSKDGKYYKVEFYLDYPLSLDILLERERISQLEHKIDLEEISRTFHFIKLEDDEQLYIEELYKMENGVYNFTYFDKRFKRFDSITNTNGEVIDFIGGVDGWKFTGYDEDSDGLIDGYN